MYKRQTEDATADDTEEVEDVADEAQETLDDAGVDTEAGGSAEVQFLGETYAMTADESFGCFLTADGGSQGTVNFDGEDEQGNRLMIDWAGDSPDTAVISFEFADGTEWTTPFDGADVDVTLTPPSAVVATTLVSLTDGAQEDLVARPICQ